MSVQAQNGGGRYSSNPFATEVVDRRRVASTTPRSLYSRERPGTIVQEAGWTSGPAWTGAETGIGSPGRPARCERYTGRTLTWLRGLNYPHLLSDMDKIWCT